MDSALSIVLPALTSSNSDPESRWQKTMEFFAKRARAAHAPPPQWRLGKLGYTAGLGVGRSNQ